MCILLLWKRNILRKIEEEYEFATVKLTGKNVICDKYGKSIRLSGEDESEKLVNFEGCRAGEFGLGEYIRLKSEDDTEVMKRCLSCISDYEFLDVTKVDMADSYNILSKWESLEMRMNFLIKWHI